MNSPKLNSEMNSNALIVIRNPSTITIPVHVTAGLVGTWDDAVHGGYQDAHFRHHEINIRLKFAQNMPVVKSS